MSESVPRLTVVRPAYDAVVDAALAGDDREVCGVLAGTRDGTDRRVAAVHPVENAAERPRTRYAMAPEEQHAVLERVEDAGRDVVGFYHSHPAGPPRPSETDAAQATWPDYSYAICALDGHPYLGSWRWRGAERGFERELVVLD